MSSLQRSSYFSTFLSVYVKWVFLFHHVLPYVTFGNDCHVSGQKLSDRKRRLEAKINTITPGLGKIQYRGAFKINYFLETKLDEVIERKSHLNIFKIY